MSISKLSSGTGAISSILSYLPPTEIAKSSLLNRSFREEAKSLLSSELAQEIQGLAPETSLARFVMSQHLTPALEDSSERVKKVYSAAFECIAASESLLSLEDRVELGLHAKALSLFQRVFKRSAYRFFEKSDFSITRLSSVMEGIQNKNLERVFMRIVEQIPEVQRPVISGNICERATLIRNWMAENQGTLDGITGLELRNLDLTCLPPEISLLQNLRYLYLADNPLIDLPDSLDLPQLQTLELTRTRITHLPTYFNTSQLRSLLLACTSITHLPENFNAIELQNLVLSYTPITHLPQNFNAPQLAMLLLDHSQIEGLPDAFSAPQLVTLLFNGSRLRSFPEALNLPQLEELRFDSTWIEALPSFNAPQIGCVEKFSEYSQGSHLTPKR